MKTLLFPSSFLFIVFPDIHLDKGADIRLIEELFGESGSITTDRYTHITQKGFEDLKSPMDCLDIDKEKTKGSV